MKILQEKPTELREVQDAGKGATLAIAMTVVVIALSVLSCITLSAWLVFKFIEWIVSLF